MCVVEGEGGENKHSAGSSGRWRSDREEAREHLRLEELAGRAAGPQDGLVPTGPLWPLKSRVRLLPSMLAMLMLSPSVQ